jgi:hypothetical protein
MTQQKRSMDLYRFTSALPAILLAALGTGKLALGTEPRPPKLCIDDTNLCAPDPVHTNSGIKWHPGHYAETQTYGSVPDTVVRDIAGVDEILGVTQRYNWSTLEPTRGNYNFAAIRADLAKLRPHGKRLILLLMDRSWGKNTSTAHLPVYLSNELGVNGIVDNPIEGICAAIWIDKIMDRMIALDAALAEEFDDEPLFEGIRFEEITPGMTPGAAGVPQEYTVSTMVAQWKRLATAARKHWRNTNVFLNTNTLGGISGPLEIIEHAYQVGGIGVGGPDVLPPGADDYQIAGDRVITRSPNTVKGDKTALFLRDYRGQLPICHSVQTPELGGKEGAFTPQQLADYGIGQAGDTHMSWVVAPSTVQINWKTHILPYLSGNPRPTVQACPKRYVDGCVTK